MTASSSTDSTLNFDVVGPVFWSAVEVRFFDFAAVFGRSQLEALASEAGWTSWSRVML